MGTLLERNLGIARRCEDLAPIAERVRAVLVEGKREQLLDGEDCAGRPFAPLAPSTLRYRRGPSTPLVEDGPASRLVTMYRVTVSALSRRIEVSAGWPGLDFVKYLRSGTRRMPARDPGGFRPADKAECGRILWEWIFRG